MQNYDEKLTAKNARCFFQQDFWHYMNVGGMRPDRFAGQLSSPIISDMPVNHSNENNVEKTLVRTMSKAEENRLVAEVILIAMFDCTNIPNKRHRDILIETYIDDLSREAVRMRLNFSEYQIKHEKMKALCEFAERLNFWRVSFQCKDRLPNLLAKLNNKTRPKTYQKPTKNLPTST